MNITAV